MTLASLIDLASWAAAVADDNITWEDYEEIKDFAKTWRELGDVELEDLDLRKRAEL